MEVEQIVACGIPPKEPRGLIEVIKQTNILEIELVAKSLCVVDISNTGKGKRLVQQEVARKRKKWAKRKIGKKVEQNQLKLMVGECGKR